MAIKISLEPMAKRAVERASAEAKHAKETPEDVRETANWLNTDIQGDGLLEVPEESVDEFVHILEWGEENIPRHSGTLNLLIHRLEQENKI